MATDPRELAILGRFAQDCLGLNLARGGTAKALERYAAQRTVSDGSPPLVQGELVSPAFQALVGAVTVQHSWLFRDSLQLEIAAAALHSGARAWVPACAKGEDAHSLAALCDAAGRHVSVLGTDICASALEHARRAVYDSWATREVPDSQAGMLQGSEGQRQVVERVRRLVRFELHNLLEPPPKSAALDGKWDLILCRNVLIYFTPQHAKRVVAFLRDALAPGGMLLLGASDILAELPVGLEPVVMRGRVTFRRLEPGVAADSALAVQDLILAPMRPPPIADPGAISTAAPFSSTSAAPCPTSLPRSQAPMIAGPLPSTPSQATPVIRSLQPTRAGPFASGHPAAVIRSAGPPTSEPESASLPPAIARAVSFPEQDHSHESDAAAAVAHLLEGIERHLSGELQPAVKELRTALYLMPHCWPASYYLALTYDAMGRCDEARREYSQVSRCIDKHIELPTVPGHDFSFLERDVAAIARRRARAPGR